MRLWTKLEGELVREIVKLFMQVLGSGVVGVGVVGVGIVGVGVVGVGVVGVVLLLVLFLLFLLLVLFLILYIDTIPTTPILFHHRSLLLNPPQNLPLSQWQIPPLFISQKQQYSSFSLW